MVVEPNDEYIVISNHKFADRFSAWAKTKKQKIIVLDDGTASNDTRLGAVKDIQFAIDELMIDDDALVIAGDNLLDFSLTEFVNYAKAKNTTSVMRYYEPDPKKLSKSGVLVIDQMILLSKCRRNPTIQGLIGVARLFITIQRQMQSLLKRV